MWRPLRGPNNDWPLAVCDFASIDASADMVDADLLYSTRLGSNQLLFDNASHQWHYIPNQQPDDLLVFRNVSSELWRASKFSI